MTNIDGLIRIRHELRARMEHCVLCPNACGVNRLLDETGLCETGRLARIASFGAHHGEEAPISGSRGSGAIFFSGCNLKCRFCQNYDISQLGQGREVTMDELAEMMIKLQRSGCHNINFVSPSHVVYQIVEALLVAVGRGLTVPLVYNTGGYDAQETLETVDGVFDIYMPDMKFAHSARGLTYSGVRSYVEVNRRAISEMYRQVGDLALDGRGVAQRGLLVRLLVLPEDLAGVGSTARFLAQSVSLETAVNVMDQYRPCYEAGRYPELSRRPTAKELDEAIHAVVSAGLHRFV